MVNMYCINTFLSPMQIAYVSSSIELSDRNRFPNFFRTYPSDADFAPAIVTLIQEYGWRQMGFITQDEGLFTEVSTLFNMEGATCIPSLLLHIILITVSNITVMDNLYND